MLTFNQTICFVLVIIQVSFTWSAKSQGLDKSISCYLPRDWLAALLVRVEPNFALFEAFSVALLSAPFLLTSRGVSLPSGGDNVIWAVLLFTIFSCSDIFSKSLSTATILPQWDVLGHFWLRFRKTEKTPVMPTKQQWWLAPLIAWIRAVRHRTTVPHSSYHLRWMLEWSVSGHCSVCINHSTQNFKGWLGKTLNRRHFHLY